MRARTIILAMALGFSGLAVAKAQPGEAAANQSSSSGASQDKRSLASVKKESKSLRQRQRAQLQEINSKEKAELDALRADPNLSPGEKTRRMAAVRKQYEAQRREVNEAHAHAQEKLRADVPQSRPVIHVQTGRYSQQKADGPDNKP